MMVDQAESLRNIVKQRQEVIQPPKVQVTSRVITVTSGKGGVGKSNFTANLGISLSKTGKRVVIIDADFGLANIEVLFGIIPQYSLANVLSGQKELKDIISEGPHGVKFLSGGSGLRDLANINERQMTYIIEKLSYLDSVSDIILIDTGAGISDSVLNFVKASKEAVIITTPEPTSVTDGYAIIKAVRESNGDMPEIKVIINRVDDSKEGFEIFDKISKVAKRFLEVDLTNLGYIPYDNNVIRAVKSQQPLIMTYPNSEASKAIEAIAGRLLDSSLPLVEQKAGIKGFMRRLSGIFK
ncbi:MAG: MinD/ParA family protein [Clostridiales bacterium]|jgi:flagellar biosynthesis protein FlhG|nr:MinD/ParA family protein [Clostridiales bacterium]